MNTLLEILGTIAATITVLLPFLRKLFIEKQSLAAIALSFAKGYDNAKADLPPAQKDVVSTHLASAALQAGVHPAVLDFLARHGLNQPAAAPPQP